MNVSQLIEALKALPPDAEVGHLWDGRVRTKIQHVWLARNGSVVTSDYEMVCYDGDQRPIDAPTEEQERHWYTPVNPNPVDEWE